MVLSSSYSSLVGCSRCSTKVRSEMEHLDGEHSRKRRRENNRTPRLRRKSEYSVVGHSAGNGTGSSFCREPLSLEGCCEADAGNRRRRDADGFFDGRLHWIHLCHARGVRTASLWSSPLRR